MCDRRLYAELNSIFDCKATSTGESLILGKAERTGTAQLDRRNEGSQRIALM